VRHKTRGLLSKTETFRFRTEALKPVPYVVVQRVRDAAGNTASGDVVFTVQARAAPPSAPPNPGTGD
jgi:hypothetical protein